MEARRLDRSAEMFERAVQTHAAGVSSSTRGRRAGWYPIPPVIEKGEGPYLYDVDGNQYLDYLGAHGPLILGHRPEAVTNAVARAIQERGATFALPYDLEYQVSEKLVEYIPSIQKVKFSNSGSEACHYAVRLARAYTGKDKILKFEGHYHGWTDVIHFSYHPSVEDAGPEAEPETIPECPGIPDSFRDEVVVAPWNDREALSRIVDRHKNELAAVIAEPIMGNSGVIWPEPGYMEFVRQITRENGILLIFDEIITGFRNRLGGAQADLNVTPDITILGKALGAGFVVSAYGGSDEVMQGLVDEVVMHGGTYNSNVIAMAAANAALSEMARPGFYESLNTRTRTLAEGINRIFSEAGVPVAVQRYGSLFTPFFSEREIRSYRDVLRYSSPAAFTAFSRALIQRGIIMYPFYMGRWYVSAAHSDEDIENTLDRVQDAVPEVKAAL